MNTAHRRTARPATLRDYLAKVVPRTSAKDRIALERILISIVNHQERWAGLQRSTARDQLAALRGRCDICSRSGTVTKGNYSAQVPIQMVDGIMDCMLADDGLMPTFWALEGVTGALPIGERLKHWSVDRFCSIVNEECWPLGYASAMNHFMKELIWDFDDVRYPRWTLDGIYLIFTNKYIPESGHTWRPLLPRDGSVHVQCAVNAAEMKYLRRQPAAA